MCFVAFVFVLLYTYWPAMHGAPVWDDDAHITRAELRPVDGLRRIWVDLGATQQYYPLVHSAFWVMHRLWGSDTFGYHVSNVLLHATSALLVGLILRRLEVPGAWVAAAVFAVHPVHVESVAWITELKNTLSGVLYFSAILAYLRYDRTRQGAAYAVAFVLFVLALLSKTVTATLPAALLVVFWWKRGRIDWRRDAVPLVPFLAIGVAAGMLTASVERTYIGASGFEFELSLVERCLLAGRAVWFYAATLLWPFDLAFIYPRWQIDASDPTLYLYPLAAAATLALFWWWRTRSRSPLAAALLFGGALFPALGFFDVYPFRYSFVADHFQYLASVPFIAAVVALITIALREYSPSIKAVPVAAVLVTLGWHARAESRQYVDANTLYASTLARNPDCWMCHNNLATDRLRREPPDLEGAARHLRESLRIQPSNAEAHDNFGMVLRQQGRLDDAIRAHEEAVRLRPDFAPALNNLGIALQASGRPQDALARYEASLRIERRLPEVHHNRGLALVELGRPLEAIGAIEEALRLNPAYADAHENLGNAKVRLKRIDEAVVHYQEAVRRSPGSATLQYKLGYALLVTGRKDEGVGHLREAIRIQPDLGPAHMELADALAGKGATGEAIAHYRAALQHPAGVDLPDVHSNLGVALAMMGRRDEAITHFREALRLRPDFPEARANLARAVR